MNHEAFLSALEKQGDRVYSYAVWLLGDREEARDVTQEGFMRLWAKRAAVADGAALVWLTRTIYRLCIDRQRRGAVRREKGPIELAAAMLYQRFADTLKGFSHATPQTIFRRFINTHGKIEITNNEITVCFEKRTDNPILKEGGFEEPSAPVSWLGGWVIHLEFL